MAEKQVISKKTWNIEITYYSDHSTTMSRINDGFSAVELLGICDFVRQEIHEQLKGNVKPTRVKRKVVEP